MSSSPSSSADVLATYTVDVPAAAGIPVPAAVGCPVAAGKLRDVRHLSMRDEAGEPVPLAPRPLVHWPDGSVRWALLSFLASAPGRYTLEQADDADAPLEEAVQIDEGEQTLSLDNGRITVTLARGGEAPVREIAFDGRAVVTQAADLQFVIGEASSLRGEVEAIEVLECSPVRAKVRIHGDHRDQQGARCFAYRLDVELWAQGTSLRLDYQFLNLESGAAAREVESMRMHLRPAVGESPKRCLLQHHHGPFMRPRPVQRAGDVRIRADWSRRVPYVTDRTMLEDTLEYPAYLEPSAVHASDWLGLAGGGGGLYLHMAEMVNRRPKQLASEDGALVAEIWPREAGVLSVPQGRARRHTFTLTFTPPGEPMPEPATLADRLHAPLHEGRATLDAASARSVGAFDQDRMLKPGRHPRFDRYMSRLAHNVQLATGMFDHGDGIEQGYSTGYAAIGRQPLRPGVQRGVDPMRADAPDAVKPLDSARYEPAWANNEYDLIHALCNELMRTGDRSLWPTIHALTRHNIEVDFVHYSDDPWQHHGSPAHSAYHNFASAYPSHIWTQGLLEYHCLTGDCDALEVACKLGDTIIRNLEHPERGQFLWGFNREIGWALLALVQLYELTGEPRFGEHAGAVADYLARYDRTGQAHPVKLSGVDPMDEIHHQIVGSFFGYDCMVEAMDRYARLTGRDDLKRWLREFLEQLRRAAINRLRQGRLGDMVRQMLTDAMAIGYELTRDRRFIELGMLGLEIFMEGPAWATPPSEVKAVAMTHRGLARFLHHADATGMLGRFDYAFGEILREP